MLFISFNVEKNTIIDNGSKRHFALIAIIAKNINLIAEFKQKISISCTFEIV